MTTHHPLILAAIAIAVSGCAETQPRPIPEPASTHVSMVGIVSALKVALPASLSAESFADPNRQEALGAALARLRVEAGALGAHGAQRDASFAHLSGFLALEAAEIDRRYREGELEAARFLLRELGGTCVACHARLPAAGESELGRELFDSVDRAALGRAERLELELATRQFDRALVEYEELLRDPMIPPSQLDLGGFLAGYLRVCIRVEGDLARPRTQLSEWRARSELPNELALLVSTWTDALAELQLDVSPGEELDRAREVQAAADAVRRFPRDRAAVVHDLVASSLLLRGLARASIPEADLPEAYLRLGMAELLLPDAGGRQAPEAYLATAITTSPGSAIAREAFDHLEAETLANYTGSAGGMLPPDVASWLDGLRALADIE